MIQRMKHKKNRKVRIVHLISGETWRILEFNGGERLTPFVTNNSSSAVFYKPEGKDKDTKEDVNPYVSATGAYKVGAKLDLYSRVDGINTVNLAYNEVFKIPDNARVVINATCDIDLIYWIDITPGVGRIKTPDGGWHKLRDSLKKTKPAWYEGWFD